MRRRTMQVDYRSMFSTHRTRIATRVSQCMTATALTAGLTLGGGAIAEPATACAAPGEWDIGHYEGCLADIRESLISAPAGTYQSCCDYSQSVLSTGVLGNAAQCWH
jgi:hypothetical protein